MESKSVADRKLSANSDLNLTNSSGYSSFDSRNSSLNSSFDSPQQRYGHGTDNNSIDSADLTNRLLINNVRSENGNAECSDKSDTDSSDSFDEEFAHIDLKDRTHSKTIQPLTIIKINDEKVDTAIDKQHANTIKSNNTRINFMIESYNSEFGSSSRYKEQPDQGTYNNNSKFNRKIYVKGPQTITFLYRSDAHANEIFALTCGASRSVVINWADTNFPWSVGSAIRTKQSVTRKQVKSLHERQFMTTSISRKGGSLNDSSDLQRQFEPKICTGFNASTSNGQLQQIMGSSDEEQINMQVSQGSISFPAGVSDINKCAEVCEVLSSIYNNPLSPNELNGYLRRLSKTRKAELEPALLKTLLQFFRLTSASENNEISGKLANFSIILSDTNCNGFRLYKKSSLLATFSKHVQLDDLHRIVRENVDLADETFEDSFNNLFISATPTPGKEPVKETLFNCLELIFYDDLTEKDYWINGDAWYESSSCKYYVEVFKEYIRVQNESLLDKADCCFDIKWPLKLDRTFPVEAKDAKEYKSKIEFYKKHRFVNEGFYCELYKDRTSIIVTDSHVVSNGIETCDFFQHIPHRDGTSTVYLHHAKKAFDVDGYRSAFCQILDSARFLYNSLNTDGGSKNSPASKLYDFVVANRKDSSEIYKCKDLHEFRECLRKAVFSFCPLFLSGERDLDKLKDFEILSKYNFSDIEGQIDKSFREKLKNELYSFLLSSEYIYPNGDLTTKWYDACSVQNDRGFHVKNEKGFFVDPFPNEEFSNLKPKILRKKLKAKYYQNVDGLAIKQQICSLKYELGAMGFGFQICQIEGENDPYLNVI